MEIVLLIEKKDYQKIREILLKDEVSSKASIKFKDASMLGKEGYYCYISRTEEQCKKALELTKEVAKKVSEEEEKKVIKEIKEEENKANEGFGAIFG